MTTRRIVATGLLLFPFVAIAIVFALSAYTGCEIDDRPFRFLGDDCVKNGVHWNRVAAPLGMLALSWVIIGPVLYIAFVVVEKGTALARRSRVGGDCVQEASGQVRNEQPADRRKVDEQTGSSERNVIDYQTPWVPISDYPDENGLAMSREALREIGAGHPAGGRRLTTLARHQGCDDVLFLLDDGPKVAVVHLTWSGRREKNGWPVTEVFSSLAEFQRTRMAADAEENED